MEFNIRVSPTLVLLHFNDEMHSLKDNTVSIQRMYAAIIAFDGFIENICSSLYKSFQYQMTRLSVEFLFILFPRIT